MINDIELDLVSLEVAELLALNGFAVECDSYYENGQLNYFHSKENFNDANEWRRCTSAPSQAIAIKWVKLNFEIDICIHKFNGYYAYRLNEDTDFELHKEIENAINKGLCCVMEERLEK